jgi:MinD-like ATPase involved in chromosome partitioning or flagellar assembly
MEKILVHSYKGGTGKTTVAINLARLVARDHKVLLIESDFLMPSFFYIFDQEPSLYFNDYLNGKTSLNDVIVPDVQPNMDVIFTDKKYDPNEKIVGTDQRWFLSTLQKLNQDFETLQNHYDYIVFDTPPGWHLVIINLIMLSDKAILILRPNSYAVKGTKRLVEMVYKRAKPMSSWEIFLLFNQVPEVEMSADLQQWAEEFQQDGIKYAGFIDCSCTTSYQMAHDAMLFPADHQFNLALQAALSRIFAD